MKRLFLLSAAAVILQAGAIQGRNVSDYIEWGSTSHNFPAALSEWTPGTPFTADDNFFISRVKPRARFTNTATQVHPEITPDKDKNLIYWVPIGTPPDNALPSGNFDSDMFSMWSYVTHFGNWSAPMARIPGNFSDAAHRNGVGVSPLLGIPWGTLSADWSLTLRQMLDVGPEKMSEFLEYYGIDGLGYNSEFQLNTSIAATKRPKNVNEISSYNADLVRIAGERGRNGFMNIWYDGTADDGLIKFDRGLSSHNYNTFGPADKIASSLFFNYNWNNSTLMKSSVAKAESMGRSPLDLYVGFNMQGGEPRKTTQSWSLLKNYPLSIGLWGAHSESMMYESRREMGGNPLTIQQTYLLRTEWWFSGGTRNPASAPAIKDTWNYSGKNTEFFGMARMMSARSALTEPFVTNFNLGNGRFFNFKGERKSDTPWANIGIQDILPTWRFWWSNRLLGGNAADVPAQGLDASFVWDDAWLGGSSLKISGTIAAPEYLHLFKTSIPLASDDKIFVRYKLIEGSAYMQLVLTEEGAEDVEIRLPASLRTEDYASQQWRVAEFNLSEVAPQLIGKKISLVALRFNTASNLDMRLGGFGITQDAVATPPTPIVTHTELLSASSEGIDGKIIWDMPDGKEKRYNDDQGVSFFQLYYQQEGGEPVMQSGTSSWAGLLLNSPIGVYDANPKVRFGVAAVGLDFITQSDIAWGEWHQYDSSYELSHAIVSHLADNEKATSITEVWPDTEVAYRFKDPMHPEADWSFVDSEGNEVMSAKGVTSMVAKASAPGHYTLRVSYPDANGATVTDEYPDMLCVMERHIATTPQITDFDYQLVDDETIRCSFEATPGDGLRSRALNMDGRAFGFKASEVGLSANKTWSLGFWLRPEAYYEDETHLVSVRDKTQAWAKNEWGWLWSTIGKDGKGIKVNIRKEGDTGSVVIDYPDVTLTPGVWTALGYSFKFIGAKAMDFGLYVNGEKVEPASYTDTNGTTHAGGPGALQQLYAFSAGNVVSVGGTLFKNGGVEGALDNVTYWTTDLTGGRAELAMKDIDPANAPEGLEALYTFEQDAAADFTFVNELPSSAHASAKAGRFHYNPQLTEGSGVIQYVAPDFRAGTSHLSAKAAINAEVKWIAPGADITAEGDASKGEAVLKYKAGGVYKVTLRIENPCGYDEREVNLINVPGPSGVEQIEAESGVARSRVMIAPDGVLVLNFEEAGKYNFEAVTMDGRVVKQSVISTLGGRTVITDLPTQTPLVIIIR